MIDFTASLRQPVVQAETVERSVRLRSRAQPRGLEEWRSRALLCRSRASCERRWFSVVSRQRSWEIVFMA